jgi:SAM-dependent methyltransferase
MGEPSRRGFRASDRVGAEAFDRDHYADENLAWWTPLLVELGGISAGRRVLDVGCATGGFAIAIAGRTGARVVGCDLSLPFLGYAGTRPGGGVVGWTAADGQRLPFAGGAFDCVVLSLVLHQVADRGRAVAEAFRVLGRPGVLVVRTVLPEDVAGRIPFRFFPTLAARQAALMPSLDELAGWAAAAGFAGVRGHRVRRDRRLRLEEVEGSFRREAARRYPFLSGRELEEGLARMRADWEGQGRRWVDPRPTQFVVAAKR